MNILILISLAFFISAYLGWGIFGLARRGRIDLPYCLIFPFGYSLGQLLFFPAYFLLGDAKRAVISLLALATIPNLIYGCQYLARHKNTSHHRLPKIKREYLPYLAGGMVIIFAALPYAYSGFGRYWHSANEDIIDGLNGRDAYLNRDLLEKDQGLNPDSRLRGNLAAQQLVKMGITPEKDTSFFKDRYVHELGCLQYSSLAFWSVVLGIPQGIDAFLVQALLNLGLFAMGVFIFAVRIFGQPVSIAFVATMIAAAGNFYLTTYLNGHEGSLMYNAIAPFLLFCFLQLIEKKQRPGAWLLMLGIFVIFLLGAYPYPLPYLALPAMAYASVLWFADRKVNGEITYDSLLQVISRPLFLSLAILCLVAVFTGSWVVLEPIRLRAISQFRSWGTMLNHVGILQFWGLWPSSGSHLGTLDRQLNLKIASLILAFVLSWAAVYGFMQFFKKKIAFMLVWLPAWVAFFFLMRTCVYDSYYFYKFLYINAWLIIIPTVAGIFVLIHSAHKKFCYGGLSLLAVWLGANIANNIGAFYGLEQKAYNNNFLSYKKVGLIPKEMLRGTYIDIPFYDHGDVTRQVFIAQAIIPQVSKEKAAYLLTFDGVGDVLPEPKTAIVWNSDEFTLKKAPDADLLEIATYFEPEVEGGIASSKESPPFRWISDSKNSYIALNIYRRTKQSNYLYLCAESGPSIDYGMVDVSVSDADGRIAGTIGVSSYACKFVDIENYRAPFTLSHKARGKLISAVEQRKLIYRVFHIGVVANPDEILTQEQMVRNRDITPVKSSWLTGKGVESVGLGKGWAPFEKFAGDNFRWAGSAVELILTGGTTDGVANIALELEPGPSHGSHPLHIDVLDESGKTVFISAAITGRTAVVLPLSYRQQQTSVYTLQTNSDSLPISGDPRMLNYRVFSITTQ